MIEVETLTRAHLAAFEPETPMSGPIPEDQFGQAAVGLKDGKPLAIVFVWERDGAAELGVVMSRAARKFPFTLHRLARGILEGLHVMGFECIRTWPDSPRSAAWLRRLGFQSIGGAFEKWQIQ